jgi:uncharacterized iron-regulated membrane protein
MPAKPSLRTFFFWIHLAAGTVASLPIFAMCATGVVMMYQSQTEVWVDHWGIKSHPPMRKTLALNIEDLILEARRRWGVAPESITIFPGVTQPVEIYLNRKLGSFYLDAYSGTLIGQPSQKIHQFFQRVKEWHVSLGVSGAHRPMFHRLIVIADAALLLLAIAGIYLWVPRQWTWVHLRPVILFQWGKTGRARDFNWHNALGIWSVIPIIVMAWTGLAMSGGWASRLTYRVTDTLDRSTAREGAVITIVQPNYEAGPMNMPRSNLDTLLSRAKQHSAQWKAITMYLPHDDLTPVDFAIDMSGYRGIGKIAALELDRFGQVLSFTEAGGKGIQAATFIRYGHTGEAWGVAGQTIAGTASLAGTILVWTGVALSLRRLRNWKARRSPIRYPSRRLQNELGP